MAKKSNGRVRVFFAEVEGDDETIQAGLQAVAAAVGKTFQPKVVVRNVQSNTSTAIESDDDQLEQEADSFEAGWDDDSQVLDGISKKKKEKSKKAKKPQKLSIVADLDLKPASEQHLSTFYNSFSPTKQYEKITLCVYYLKKVLKIDGVSPDHVYSCMKEVGLTVPNDLAQTLRNIGNRQGVLDASDIKDVSVTTPGENLVEHKIAKGE